MCPKEVDLAATDAIARIDGKVRDKLLKRAHKYGLTDQGVEALAQTWKRAAVNTKDLKVAARAQRPPNPRTRS